jgi:hypothetical protein
MPHNLFLDQDRESLELVMASFLQATHLDQQLDPSLFARSLDGYAWLYTVHDDDDHQTIYKAHLG